ncbi:hypothetical protein ACFX2G_008730 [Malus domestica]
MMKKYSDKKKTERHFTIGDFVYLKLIPYHLRTLAPHNYHKLQPRYYGPYEVLEKISNVAYKLKLPEGTKIHLVFHVSCIKKQLGNHAQTMLPQVMEDGLAQNNPKVVIARRIYKKGNSAGVQILVQWQDQ